VDTSVFVSELAPLAPDTPARTRSPSLARGSRGLRVAPPSRSPLRRSWHNAPSHLVYSPAGLNIRRRLNHLSLLCQSVSLGLRESLIKSCKQSASQPGRCRPAGVRVNRCGTQARSLKPKGRKGVDIKRQEGQAGSQGSTAGRQEAIKAGRRAENQDGGQKEGMQAGSKEEEGQEERQAGTHARLSFQISKTCPPSIHPPIQPGSLLDPVFEQPRSLTKSQFTLAGKGAAGRERLNLGSRRKLSREK
jgi:hypothetical protein